MSEYKPGTVAVATVRGVKGVRVMRVKSNYAPTVEWASALGEGHRLHEPRDVANVRPLVVLDPEDWAKCADLSEAADHLESHGWNGLAAVVRRIEEQTKPPRIPEPGVWGVVESTVTYEGTTYSTSLVRHPGPGVAKRWLDQSGSWFFWDDLINPVLIREGVAS